MGTVHYIHHKLHVWPKLLSYWDIAMCVWGGPPPKKKKKTILESDWNDKVNGMNDGGERMWNIVFVIKKLKPCCKEGTK